MRLRSHPGLILRHEFLEPFDISATALAAKLDVPANRISEIVRGRRDVTADTALRLAAFFDTTPEFWMNLQVGHDLSKAAIELARRHSSSTSKKGGSASRAAKVLKNCDAKGEAAQKSKGAAASGTARVLKPSVSTKIRKLAG